MRATWSLLTLAVLSGLLGSVAGAQVAGVVVRSDAPVEGATVVLWAAEREVGRQRTTREGRFAFSPEIATRASALSIRRLGFTPRTLSVRPGDDALRLQLTPIAQPLPAQAVVERVQRRCPLRESVEDRRYWNGVRATYWQSPRQVGIATLRTVVSAEVEAARVGEFSDDSTNPSFYGVTGLARRDYYATVAKHGMAVRLPPPRAGQMLFDPAFFHWSYAGLHLTMAEYFLSDEFAETYAFRRRVAPDSAVAVDFCPRDRAVPSIEGRIDVGPDGVIRRIAWSFVTPKPREDAGGELLVVPPVGAVGRRLIPARSVYWRRLAGRTDRYFQETRFFRGWYWGQTEAIPYEAAGR